MRARLAYLVVCMSIAGIVHADEPAQLVAAVEVRVIKTAEIELGRVEKALRAQPDLPTDSIANITMQLQTAIEEDLGRGPVRLQPRAIYDACVARLHNGDPPAVVARALVGLQRRGELVPAEGPALPAPAAPPAREIKKVASFVFDKDRLRSPDPHLPPTFHAAPGARLKGIYQICVDTTGKVTKVTTVQSLSGADREVMEQLRTTWLYKPQPVPVCTERAFVFQFN